DDALSYISGATPEEFDEEPSWRAMLRTGPRMLKMLEERTPLRFRLTREPDLFPAVKGFRAEGRMLSPLPLSRLSAGRYAFTIRGSTLPELYTYHDVIETDLYHSPFSTTLSLLPRLLPRALTLSVGKGVALMAGLVRGCVDAGCTFVRSAEATELICEDDEIKGAVVRWRGGEPRARARLGTLIATGGFEWNASMIERYMPGPMEFFGGPRSLTGDGHLM